MTVDVRVIHADCRDAIKEMADCSIDSAVTDPPYALVSIVKRFGKPGSAPAKGEGATGVYRRASAGFMGQAWDTGDTAFDPEFWAEVLRVLKPGGHLLSFSSTRTYHHMAMAIEVAGFEIRDQVGWLYGSGFPKNHNIGKAIDRMAGAEREVIATRQAHDIRSGNLMEASQGHGRGKMEYAYTAPAMPEPRAWQGWGTALKPAWEPIVLARKPLVGTVAENVIKHGTGALNIDGCRIEAEEGTGRTRNVAFGLMHAGRQKQGGTPTESIDQGRWPANVIHDGSDEVLRAFPDSDGQQRPVIGTEKPKKGTPVYGDYERVPFDFRGDSGSAARFFYSAKADADDRLGSKHPTVKPVDLIAYLCRLITPPGGTILDPFAGSGTTGMAAMREGFNAVLIEREAEYIADIKRRIAHVQGLDAPLFAEAAQ